MDKVCKLAVLSILLFICFAITSVATAQQTSGYCYIQIVNQEGKPLPFIRVTYKSPGSRYYSITTTGSDGKFAIWLSSEQLGQEIEVQVYDLFNKLLQADKSVVICEKFDETKTITLLNARIVTIRVYDEYMGNPTTPPPLTAVVNSYDTMYKTITPDGRIQALLPGDFEGTLTIGAPLRKDVPVVITKDKNEYVVTLEPALRISASMEDNNLVINGEWDSLAIRDIGEGKLIPYSMEILVITSNGVMGNISKMGPVNFESVSGSGTVTIPLPEGEPPSEVISGALIVKFYIDYEIKSSDYWEELSAFGETSWIRFLAEWYGGHIKLQKIPLLQLAYNPFADPSLSEKLTELSKKLESKEAALEEANKKLQSANEELSQLTSQVEEMQSKVDALQEKVQNYEKEISSLQDELKSEKERSASLQASLEEEESLRKTAESKVMNLMQENAELKKDLEVTRMLVVLVGVVAAIIIALLAILYIRRRRAT